MKKRQIALSLALAGLMSVSTVFGSLGQLKTVNYSKPEAKATTSQKAAAPKRNVIYYGDWSVWGGEDNCYPQSIPADLYTHINFAFMDFNADGSLRLCDPDAAAAANLGQPGITWGDVNAGLFPAFSQLKAKNPNVKFGLSLGGWSKSNDFSVVCASDAARTKFVKNIMDFIRFANMDFVDIDWEYPGLYRDPDTVDNKNDEGTVHADKVNDKANYIKLLQDLRTALDKQGVEVGKKYELSAALPIAPEKVEVGIDVAKMFKLLDFGNIMTYDINGAWSELTGHHANLYGNPKDPEYAKGWSVDQSIKFYMDQGAPPDKLVIGSAFYSRGWGNVEAKGTDPALPGLYAKASIAGKDSNLDESKGALNDKPMVVGDGGRRAGNWAWRNQDKLKATYPGLKEYWDDTAKAAYMYDASTKNMFTYDNPRSIQEKTKYVNENNLGGMISWMASNDKDTGSGKRDELSKVQAAGLYGDAKLPALEIKDTPLKIDVKVSTYKGENGDQGYQVTLTNNEKLGETSDPAVKVVENQFKHITLPKLYVDNSGVSLSQGGYDGSFGAISQKDGKTVIDFSTVYDNKTIAPGMSKTFKLRQTGDVNIANLKSIELTQRTSTSGPEMKKQVVYGAKGDVEVNTAPTILGAVDVEIKVGQKYDVRSGITASDKEDGDLTNTITVQHNLNTAKAGKYTVTYTVKDSKGLITTAKRIVTVVDDTIIDPIDPPDPIKNTLPVIAGVRNASIEEGTPFDPLIGITASDKEDGDLTSKIKVAGKVDTMKPGKYIISYSVFDSQGASAMVAREITITAKVLPPKPDGEGNFGVGQGIKWEDQVFAPYVDVCAWTPDTTWANGGSLSLPKIAKEKGVKYFNLGFLNYIDNSIKPNGALNWGIGGYALLSEANKDDEQYCGIKKNIKDLRAMGGDVAFSIGGANGKNFFQATTDVKVLEATYKEVITGFGLTRLDLDIEGGAQGYSLSVPNAKALAKVQKDTGVEIVLTLPVLPTGLTYEGLETLRAYVENGVNLKAINIMTMCYGSGSINPGEDYGDASTRAVDSLKNQLKVMYAKNNKPISDEQAYRLIGTTVSIGYEASSFPMFGTDLSKKVVDHATAKGIGMTSFWSMNRDTQTVPNEGIKSLYGHTDAFLKFKKGGIIDPPDQNTVPVISGGSNKTIAVGDAFDPKALGVTAKDNEDGDLTSSIIITGKVDTAKAGKYDITYTVTDSGKLSAKKTLTITVAEKVVGDVIPWTLDDQAAGKHVAGIKVSYKGVIYVNATSGTSWWAEPSATSTVWKVAGSDTEYIEPDAKEWSLADQAAGLHVPGIKVTYQGGTYQQVGTGTAWWAEPGTPSANGIWKLI
ncbi:MAG: glycosyl hydrolase family 18 protein [Oscillospiraceae bacterium]